MRTEKCLQTDFFLVKTRLVKHAGCMENSYDRLDENLFSSLCIL